MSPILQALAPSAVSLLGAVLCLMLSRLTALATSKLKNERAVAFLERLDHLAEDVVLEANQVAVAKIKAVSDGGKLDSSTARGVRDEVLAKLKLHLSPSGVRDAMKALGLPDEESLDSLLKSKIEAQVVNARAL